MNVLVVFAHPVRASFNRAILDAVEAGLAEAGHSVQVADLCAEGFQCAMVEACALARQLS
ncbi:MAG: NAD(P)H-dependent oxidoreductase [Hyphomicrobiaceae bacterium]